MIDTYIFLVLKYAPNAEKTKLTHIYVQYHGSHLSYLLINSFIDLYYLFPIPTDFREMHFNIYNVYYMLLFYSSS